MFLRENTTIPGSVIRVVLSNSGENAEIYEVDGVTRKANPFNARANGLYYYKANPGTYNEIINKPDGTQQTISGLVFTGASSIPAGEVLYDEAITITGGSYTAGQTFRLIVQKTPSGKLCTAFFPILSHGSGSQNTTAPALLPLAYRPLQAVRSVYSINADRIASVRIGAAAQSRITFEYRDYAGTLFEQTSSGEACSLTWYVAD